MALFKSKKPVDACPTCGERLFMENPDGTRTCAKCGTTIGKKEGGLFRFAAEEPKSAPTSRTEACPSCGMPAELLSVEPDGTEVFRCTFCEHRFSPKRAAPAPQPKEPAKPEALDGKAIFNIAKANTVEVHAVFGKYGSAGSGFFFEEGFILTNAHVVFDHENNWADPQSITINYKGGKRHEAALIYANKDEDMALLLTKMNCKSAATIAKEAPETGEVIYAVGNTKGEGMCILEGIVSDSCREIDDLDYMMISANTFHGNSGGPVFNNKGEVVGILTLGDVEVVSMNYAIPVDRIHKFLDKALKKLEEMAKD